MLTRWYCLRDNCSPEEKDNITAEALDLSLKYNFVTPLTSMVVTKPQSEDEETLIADKLTEGTITCYWNFDSTEMIW